MGIHSGLQTVAQFEQAQQQGALGLRLGVGGLRARMVQIARLCLILLTQQFAQDLHLFERGFELTRLQAHFVLQCRHFRQHGAQVDGLVFVARFVVVAVQAGAKLFDQAFFGFRFHPRRQSWRPSTRYRVASVG